MPSTLLETPASLGQLPLADKVILMLDWVESVLHMDRNEAASVVRWHRFALDAAALINRGGGCVVKSLGDGLLAVFDDALASAVAAQGLHALAADCTASHPDAAPLHLRIGLNKSWVYACEFDVFGKGVNLTARLLTLAGPGETIVSRAVRDSITARIDIEIEDLGDCQVKHIANPVRAYRLGGAGARPAVSTSADDASLRPSIAVKPFVARSVGQEPVAIGALISDAVTAEFARIPEIRVLPAARPTAQPGRHGVVEPAAQVAAYLLCGSYLAVGNKVMLTAELADTRKGELVWVERMVGELADLCALKSHLANSLATAAMRALIDAEVRDLRIRPLPRLQSASILLGGIALMHKASLPEFDLSRHALETVVERHSQMATPRAWLAMWHVIRVVRGWSTHPAQDAQASQAQVRRALAMDPDHPMALGIDAYVRCQDQDALVDARARMAQSLELESLRPQSWLQQGVWSNIGLLEPHSTTV